MHFQDQNFACIAALLNDQRYAAARMVQCAKCFIHMLEGAQRQLDPRALIALPMHLFEVLHAFAFLVDH